MLRETAYRLGLAWSCHQLVIGQFWRLYAALPLPAPIVVPLASWVPPPPLFLTPTNPRLLSACRHCRCCRLPDVVVVFCIVFSLSLSLLPLSLVPAHPSFVIVPPVVVVVLVVVVYFSSA